MEKTRLTSDCLSCIINMQMDKVPDNCSEEMRMIYKQRVCKVLSEAKRFESAPLLIKRISDIQEELFGVSADYSKIKRFYNDYVMKIMSKLEVKIKLADDPLFCAIQYSLTGNYIDFGAMKTVDQQQFDKLLADATKVRLDESVYGRLRQELCEAKTLVFLTDNCGEIVFDQMLIRRIKELNPKLRITVVVRGKPVLNDATYEDAEQIGLSKEVQVIGNGTNVAGTSLNMIGSAAAKAIAAADVLIAKGQGNFETLQGCGLNIYYLFMCKCEMFARRFHVERYSGLLINEQQLSKS